MAGLTGADIDLLVLCTTSPDQLVPATSSPLANALAIKGGGMDINAACAGFTYGLVTAAGFIATGAERVLLIGAETLTREWQTVPTLSSSATAPEPLSSRPSRASQPSWAGT